MPREVKRSLGPEGAALVRFRSMTSRSKSRRASQDSAGGSARGPAADGDEARLRARRVRHVRRARGREARSLLPLPGCRVRGEERRAVEGMAGGAAGLHPLQKAFADLGAAQCGYCTPGFLLTAKELLEKNASRAARRSKKPSPVPSAAAPATSRSSKPWSSPPPGCGEEAEPPKESLYRTDFDKRTPAGRDKVSFGEVQGPRSKVQGSPFGLWTLDFGPARNRVSDRARTRVVGRPYPKVDAAAKVTGQTKFADDIFLPRMLHCKILRSKLAHARLLRVDVSKALALPGVVAAATGRDLPIAFGILPVSQDEHALSPDVVRYVGDPIAAVAAVDEDAALEALGASRSTTSRCVPSPRSRTPSRTRPPGSTTTGTPATSTSSSRWSSATRARDLRGRTGSTKTSSSTRGTRTCRSSSTPRWRTTARTAS